VVEKLQAAQASGNGAIATFDLTTIENKYWQVESGLKVKITFFLLGRVYNWEKLLPEDLKKQVVAPGPEDPSNIPKSGAFPYFPNYPTISHLHLTKARVSLLAHLTSWVAVENAEELDFDNINVEVSNVEGESKVDVDKPTDSKLAEDTSTANKLLTPGKFLDPFGTKHVESVTGDQDTPDPFGTKHVEPVTADQDTGGSATQIIYV
jgi:hypothetical protein